MKDILFWFLIFHGCIWCPAVIGSYVAWARTKHSTEIPASMEKTAAVMVFPVIGQVFGLIAVIVG